MSTLVVPDLDDKPWPTLGKQVADFIEERCVYGPGSLKGEPAKLDDEKLAAVYRMYEVYPKGHPFAGRRRFNRAGLSWRKGTAKTEFAAWIAFCELHGEGPVRCDGFDRYGRPVGRPVKDPYIPMLAFSKDQTEELAFAALYVVITEGPDADLFDVSLERIIRLDHRGRADGRVVPVSGSPAARDGARTTFQHLDEPHRMFLPALIGAHTTMLANMPKRPLEDPWTFYTTTAGEPGQGSVAEQVHREAELIADGKVDNPELFYFHREAGQQHDMETLQGRIDAVAEATGPVGEYAPGQFHSIARQWDRPGADKAYLERVWTNRWVRSAQQAFDIKRWNDLASPDEIPPGAFVTAGFDGARFRDSTGIVLTDINTGKQQLWSTWERPRNQDGTEVEEWEVPEAEVTAAWGQITKRFDLWECYGDPPHWTETFGAWAAKWPEMFIEWWTNQPRKMAFAVREYREAMDTGACTNVQRKNDHDELNPIDKAFATHIAAAGTKAVNIFDDQGQQMFVLAKINQDRKFDNAMAGCLSWQAYLEAIKTGAKPRKKKPFVPYRIR